MNQTTLERLRTKRMHRTIEIKPELRKSLHELTGRRLPGFAAEIIEGAKAALPAGAPATQSLRIDLEADYGLHAGLCKTMIKDFYTGATDALKLATAKAALPNCYAAMKRDGYTDAQFMQLSCFCAFWLDAIWKNSTHVAIAGERGLCLSVNNITVPHGGWWVNITLDRGYGNYFGSSTFTSNPNGAGGTELIFWEEEWIGKPERLDDKNRRIVMGDYARGSNSFFGYHEGQSTERFRINGMRGNLKDPNITVVGIQSWDVGEASNHGLMMVHKCDYGIEVVRGTPFTSNATLSLFSNTVAGMMFTGGAGNTAILFAVSCDDNRAVWATQEGYGRHEGIGLHCGGVKKEWSITPPDQRYPRPQYLFIGGGWVRLHVGFVSMALGNVYQDALISITADINTSMVEIGGFRLFGADNLQGLLHDRMNDVLWKFDVGWSSEYQQMKWSSCMSGVMVTWPKQTTSIPAPYNNVLGYIAGDPQTARPMGTFDRVAGKPTWSAEGGNGTTTGPAPVATWVLGTAGAWSTCVNNTQTRTTAYVSSIVGQTPTTAKPADRIETQACGTIPPPVATMLASWNFNGGTTANIPAQVGAALVQNTAALRATSVVGGKLVNSNTSATYPVNITGAKKVVVKGLHVDGAMSYKQIAQDLVLFPDGKFYYKSQPCTSVPAAVTSGAAAVDVTITLPVAASFAHVLAIPGNGNAFLGEMNELQFLNA